MMDVWYWIALILAPLMNRWNGLPEGTRLRILIRLYIVAMVIVEVLAVWIFNVVIPQWLGMGYEYDEIVPAG